MSVLSRVAYAYDTRVASALVIEFMTLIVVGSQRIANALDLNSIVKTDRQSCKES